MAIRTKLTVREPHAAEPSGEGRRRAEPTEEERTTRRARVAAAKDALARSANLRGEHVASARAALKAYLRNLNEARQPTEEQFKALVEGPFRTPPKRSGSRR